MDVLQQGEQVAYIGPGWSSQGDTLLSLRLDALLQDDGQVAVAALKSQSDVMGELHLSGFGNFPSEVR